MGAGWRCLVLLCRFLPAVARSEAWWKDWSCALETKGPQDPGEAQISGIRCPFATSKGRQQGQPRVEEPRCQGGGRGNGEPRRQRSRTERKQSRSGRRMPLRREMRSTRSARDTPRPSRATIATSWRPRLCNPRPGELFGTRS